MSDFQSFDFYCFTLLEFHQNAGVLASYQNNVPQFISGLQFEAIFFDDNVFIVDSLGNFNYAIGGGGIDGFLYLFVRSEF